MPHDRPTTRGGTSADLRIAVSVAIGGCVAVAAVLGGHGPFAPVAGWDAAALVFLAWTWGSIWRLDPGKTARHARPDEPPRIVADLLLLGASVVSLAAVGMVLIQAGRSSGLDRALLVGLGIVSVVLAWAVVHTVYTLRYAWLYYRDSEGGIKFAGGPPGYSDFAYLAFTIGMTFQVSDTDLQTKKIRATALRHGLLSYLFGVVIIAATINLIAGLTT